MLLYIAICSLPALYAWLPYDQRFHPADGILYSLKFSPYLGLVLVALLGWQINQTRIFWGTLFFLFTYHFLLHPDAIWLSERARYISLQILAVSFPVSLAVCYGMKESRLISDWSLARLLLGLFPILLFSSWAAWAPDLYEKAFYWSNLPLQLHRTLPPLIWVAPLPLLILLIWGLDLKVKSFLITQIAALIPFWSAIQWSLGERKPGSSPDFLSETVLPFGISTLVMFFALLRMFLQKAYWDPLTSVYNRQALDERLPTLTKDYALAMVDIDHFKGFNDTYGHAEGDNVLRMVAQHLQDILGDRIYRYGGEEFCAVFESGGLEAAATHMEKARASLAAHKFTLRGKRTGAHSRIKNPFKKNESRGKRVGITISVGVATSGEKEKTHEQVIKKADQALYKAKESGRNRVVSAEK
jgi:diguanylate cyclase (GGDEF)-like protein